MSNQKSKQKDKKTQAHIEVENKLDDVMSQYLDKDRILKTTEEKANRLGIELHEARTQNNQLKSYIKDQFEKMSLTIQNLKGRMTELTTRKNDLELQVATLKAKLDFQKKDNEQWRKQKERQCEDARRHYATELGKYETQASECTIWLNERQAMLDERAKLMEMIEQERAEFKQRLADRDRDKIQALDTLKKDNKDKCTQMKVSLLSIRREQLDNNTRLTLLQNHQLIQQLEYQSINTEKIVDQNIELGKRIKELQTELEIKKDIQKEVAKRSLFAKKILQTFQSKNTSLQKEHEELLKEKQSKQEKIQNYEKLAVTVGQLSKALELAHSKIQILEKDLTLKSAELEEQKQRNNTYKTQGSGIVQLLCRYYQQCISDKFKIDSQTEINLQQIKHKDITKWQKWQITAVVESILNKIKDHLMPTHLDIDVWRKIADSRIRKISTEKENVNTYDNEKHLPQKCSSEYIRSLSLQKNKLFYQNKRKLSAKNRSLTKFSGENTVSFGRYVQSNLREWGPELKVDVQKSLAQRFLKPAKNSLKKI